jgi:branched-subunit amino acid transport protein
MKIVVTIFHRNKFVNVNLVICVAQKLTKFPKNMLTTLEFAPAAPLTLIWIAKTLRTTEKDHLHH